MPTGSICRFFPDRCFGFIRCDDGPRRDVFFHRRNVAAHDGEIVEGQRVSFEVIADIGNRDRAINVRFINGQGKE